MVKVVVLKPREAETKHGSCEDNDCIPFCELTCCTVLIGTPIRANEEQTDLRFGKLTKGKVICLGEAEGSIHRLIPRLRDSIVTLMGGASSFGGGG